MALQSRSPSAERTIVEANGKRKRECIDLTDDEDLLSTSTALPTLPPATLSTTLAPASHTEAPIEDHDEDSMIEDYADHFEMAPFENGIQKKVRLNSPLMELTCGLDGTTGLNKAESQALRDSLMNMGPQDFLDEVLNRREMDPRHVGIAFNLDPNLDLDEATFLRLLGCTIARAFWKRKKLCGLLFLLRFQLC